MRRLLIHNAMVVDGNGTPAKGRRIVENNTISEDSARWPLREDRAEVCRPTQSSTPRQQRSAGLINACSPAGERGKPQPLEYELNIWLSCASRRSATSAAIRSGLSIRKQSAEGNWRHAFSLPDVRSRAHANDGGRARVQSLKQQGADGATDSTKGTIATSWRRWRRGAQGGTAHRAPRRGRRHRMGRHHPAPHRALVRRLRTRPSRAAYFELTNNDRSLPLCGPPA